MLFWEPAGGLSHRLTLLKSRAYTVSTGSLHPARCSCFTQYPPSFVLLSGPALTLTSSLSIPFSSIISHAAGLLVPHVRHSLRTLFSVVNQFYRPIGQARGWLRLPYDRYVYDRAIACCHRTEPLFISKAEPLSDLEQALVVASSISLLAAVGLLCALAVRVEFRVSVSVLFEFFFL